MMDRGVVAAAMMIDPVARDVVPAAVVAAVVGVPVVTAVAAGKRDDYSDDRLDAPKYGDVITFATRTGMRPLTIGSYYIRGAPQAGYELCPPYQTPSHSARHRTMRARRAAAVLPPNPSPDEDEGRNIHQTIVPTSII